jgi:hypothetical protein
MMNLLPLILKTRASVQVCVCPLQVDQLSEDERESLLRNDLRPATKPFKGNKLLLRIATHGE